MEYALFPVGSRQRNMIRFMPMMSVADYNGPLTVHTNINDVKIAGTYDAPGSDYTGPLTIHTNQNSVKIAGTYDAPGSDYTGPLTVHTNQKSVKIAGTYDAPGSDYNGPLTVFNGGFAPVSGSFERN